MLPMPSGNVAYNADPDLPTFDFTNLTWGNDPYGYNHGTNVARLAVVILSYEFPELNKDFERKALWTAATFHDLVRQDEDDSNHAQASARACEDYLRSTEFWSDERFKERVLKLIAAHEDDSMDHDPLMRCLKDADALDACRMHPGMRIGLEYFKKRTANLFTEWAKRKDNQKRYMEYRGW